MISREERQRIFTEIQRLKNERSSKYDRINEITSEIEQKRDEKRQVNEARRYHEAEARKPHMRGCGYQGGHCDSAAARLQSQIDDLFSEKKGLYKEINSLTSQINALYDQMRS